MEQRINAFEKRPNALKAMYGLGHILRSHQLNNRF